METPYVFIQNDPDEPMHEHCLAAWQGFKWLGYQVLFDPDLSGIHGLRPGTPVVGTVEAIQNLFEDVGLRAPAPLNVPDSLLGFAGRAIETSTLGDFLTGSPLPAFVKPAKSHKLWTGGVVTSRVNASLIFADQAAATPVLVSPEISIDSEYRVFVNRDKGMIGIRHYAGDPFTLPCRKAIDEMIAAYKPQAPRAYSLDVGVVQQGGRPTTIVVECNDFWALGTYGFDPVKYAELLAVRWHEMIKAA